MNHFKEEWKDILGYEGIYEISNIGNIRSYKTKKIKKTQKNKEGYERVELWKDGKRKVFLIHRLDRWDDKRPYMGISIYVHIIGNTTCNYINTELNRMGKTSLMASFFMWNGIRGMG